MSGTLRFEGKVVLVTGAGHGIGRAVAERFAREGARVVVNDVHASNAENVAGAITSAGGQALSVVADVSNRAQVDDMFERVVDRFGTVDALANNAGLIATDRHFLEGDEAWWDRVLSVNLKGGFLCSHRAAGIMVLKRAGVTSACRAVAARGRTAATWPTTHRKGESRL